MENDNSRPVVVLKVPGQLLQSRCTPSVHAKIVGISPSRLWSASSGGNQKTTGRSIYSLEDVECTIIVQGQSSTARTVTLRLLTDQLRKTASNAAVTTASSIENLSDWWCVEHEGSWRVLSECSWSIVCVESFFGTASSSLSLSSSPRSTAGPVTYVSPFMRRLPARVSTHHHHPSIVTTRASQHLPAPSHAPIVNHHHADARMYGGANDGIHTKEEKEVQHGENICVASHVKREATISPSTSSPSMSGPIVIDDDNDDDLMDQDGSLVWPPKANLPQRGQTTRSQKDSGAKTTLVSSTTFRRPKFNSSLDTLFEIEDDDDMSTQRRRDMHGKTSRSSCPDRSAPSSVVVSWCSDEPDQDMPRSSSSSNNRAKPTTGQQQHRRTSSSAASSTKAAKYQCPFDMFVTWWTKNHANFPGDATALKCWDSLPHSISKWSTNPMCRRYWTNQYGLWRAKQELKQRFTMEVEEDDGSITLIDPDEEALLSSHSQQLLHDEEILQQALVEWSAQQKDPSLLPVGLLPPPVDVRTLPPAEWTSQNVRHWLRRMHRQSTLSEDPLLYRIIKEKSIAGGRSFDYLCQFFHHQTPAPVVLGHRLPQDGVDVATVWVRRIELCENPSYVAQLNQWARDPNRSVVFEGDDQEEDDTTIARRDADVHNSGRPMQSTSLNDGTPLKKRGEYATTMTKKKTMGRGGPMIPKAFQALRTLFYMEKESTSSSPQQQSQQSALQQQQQQSIDKSRRGQYDPVASKVSAPHDDTPPAYQHSPRQAGTTTTTLSPINSDKTGGGRMSGNLPRFANISSRALALSRSRGVRSIVTYQPQQTSSAASALDMMEVDM